MDNESLTLEFYGFSKLFSYIDKGLRKLMFEKLDQYSFLSEIFLSTIDKIEIPKIIQSIATIQKLYRKYKKQYNDPDVFFDKIQRVKEYNSSLLSENYKYKCLLVSHFSIFIYLSTGVKIEIILLSYEDFKNWSNGLSFLISNKSRLASLKNKIL